MFLSPTRAEHAAPVEYPGLPLQPDQIRLIKVLPGAWSEPVRCELFNALHSTADYEALSYVWGSQKVTRKIVVNNRPYPTTINLESALRHLRERHQNGLVLWVDALCINQNDTDERTRQVQRMGQIYKMCSKAIVYLGDRLDGTNRIEERPPTIIDFDPLSGSEQDRRVLQGARASHRGVGVLDVFCLLYELSTNVHLSAIPGLGSRISREEVSQSERAMGEDGEEQIAGDLWTHTLSWEEHQRHRTLLIESLRMLMHPPYTPWWTRVWVIQEIVAPPLVDVVYGGCSAPWNMFILAARRHMRHSTFCCADFYAHMPRDLRKVLEDFCQRVTGIDDLRTAQRGFGRRVREPRPGSRSLLELLRKFRDRKASDPRDKVYALLSLVEPGEESLAPPMLPDYTLTESDVYVQATLQCIFASRSLSLFSTELGRKFRSDLPSWVPDWGAPGGYTYTARAYAVELYDACPSEKQIEEVVHLSGMSRLRLRGFEFEKIEYRGDTMWGDEVNFCRHTLAKWWLHASATNLVSPTTLDTLLCFCRLICGDMILRPQGEPIVRRVVARDELHFVAWSLESSRSPFREKPEEVRNALRTGPTQAYWDLLLLWPQLAVSVSKTSLRDRKDYVPQWQPQRDVYNISGGKRLGPDERDMIVRIIHALDLERTYKTEDLIENDGHFRTDGPWKEFYETITEHLSAAFGLDQFSNLYSTRDDIAMIDNSIMVATLSRRFVVGKKHHGLGPANAEVGDELLFLEGGKTPFVLRRRNGGGQNRHDPVEYEVIGDCYVQDLMDDGPAYLDSHNYPFSPFKRFRSRDQDTKPEWRDITLV